MAIDDGDAASTARPVTCERLSSESVRALYEVHGREVLTFLTGVLRDVESAQDICQVTFQKLLEVGHKAQSETIRGWLFKVAFHEAMAFRRQQERRKQRQQNYGTTCEGVQFVPSIDSLIKDEDVVRLKRMLNELPAEQQWVLRRRMVDDQTFATIANELKVPLGTVLTRMRLAMQKLQRMFGREGLK